MNTRKVQVTGGSTFTVSVPKDWAKQADVSAGSVVEMYPRDDVLVMQPQRDDDRRTGAIDVTGWDDEDVRRAVMALYVNGCDVLTIEGTPMEISQQRTVRKSAQDLVGLEIVDSSDDRIKLQNLLDTAELSVFDTLCRMRLVATAMLDDAVTALLESDADLSRDVIARDDDVDRMWHMVSRTFRTVLRDPGAVNDLAIDTETCFDYRLGARQLERIADHAAKIARLSLDVDVDEDAVFDSVATLHHVVSELIETAMSALLADEPARATDLATDVRTELSTIDDRVRSAEDDLHSLATDDAQRLGLVVDSLSRCADYSGNVAETALQRAAPAP
ncbi:PhoU domain-containing protein [Haloarculaceae archaeon H-GB2-1]|nr:PhoU domain-containing protein [Haloarculaceae archaeon H-GB1-1]MEA5387080.1 PhoU domain-containing protein [Haloarculaceae archaeon H-GB11]MEA5408585.1 PhoU domain-containing protein [Haloarculaceae archaeon H-GB2-1]